jgi:hypothetical protein
MASCRGAVPALGHGVFGTARSWVGNWEIWRRWGDVGDCTVGVPGPLGIAGRHGVRWLTGTYAQS